MRIGLGTVQFGLPYGVTNTDGQVSQRETMSILKYARQAGIDLLDTAAAYGSSEEVLGACLADETHPSFRIITKTVPLRGPAIGNIELDRVRQGLLTSLRDLHQPRISGVLVHHAEDLLVPGGDALYTLLKEWKAMGKVEKIGVSIYNASQIEAILARYQIDLIQLPINIFDQRLLANQLLKQIKKHGIEIHARSVFLQGVLLAQPAQLPAAVTSLRPMLERFDIAARQSGLSRLAAALGFIRAIPEIDYAIVGALSVTQLESICAAQASLAALTTSVPIDYTAFRVDDEQLVNPALWK